VTPDGSFKPTDGNQENDSNLYDRERNERAMTGPHHGDEMPCDAVVERIYEFLDGELTSDVDAQIRDHLAKCTSCYPRFRHEEVFLRFLERRAQIEKAPPSLRRRIFKALLDDEIARGES
jgi:mycothiol system anti-sigma-R factor